MSLKSQKRRNLEHNTYEKFLPELKLVGLRLIRSSSRIDPLEYRDLVLREKQNAVMSIELAYKLVQARDDSFSTTASLTLKIQEERGKSVPLLIKCTYDVHFHSSSPVRREFVRRFTDSDLRIVVWPYFRQFVSDLTSRMGIPPVTIPLSTESPDERMAQDKRSA